MEHRSLPHVSCHSVMRVQRAHHRDSRRSFEYGPRRRELYASVRHSKSLVFRDFENTGGRDYRSLGTSLASSIPTVQVSRSENWPSMSPTWSPSGSKLLHFWGRDLQRRPSAAVPRAPSVSSELSPASLPRRGLEWASSPRTLILGTPCCLYFRALAEIIIKPTDLTIYLSENTSGGS